MKNEFVLALCVALFGLFKAWRKKRADLLLASILVAGIAMFWNPFGWPRAIGYLTLGIASASFAIINNYVVKKEREGLLFAVVFALFTTFLCLSGSGA